MSTEQNVEIVKSFLAALGRRDKQIIGFATGRIKATKRTFEEHWDRYAGTGSGLRDGREHQAFTHRDRVAFKRLFAAPCAIANKKQIRRIARDKRMTVDSRISRLQTAV